MLSPKIDDQTMKYNHIAASGMKNKTKAHGYGSNRPRAKLVSLLPNVGIRIPFATFDVCADGTSVGWEEAGMLLT